MSYDEIARAYARAGNRSVASSMLRRACASNELRKEVNELVRLNEPRRLEAHLAYAAHEGLPGEFSETAAQLDEIPEELEQLSFEHALFRWYYDRENRVVTLDIEHPAAAQKMLLLSRLGLTREQERRLDLHAECIARDWAESLEKPFFESLSLDAYLRRPAFDPKLC